MKKTIISCWLSLLFCVAISGQSPYHLKTGKEFAISGAGLGIGITSLYIAKNLDPLTPQQISLLSTDDLSNFERWITTQRSVSSHKTSNIFLYGSQLFPIALTLLDKPMRKDAFTIGVLYSQTALINISLTSFFKHAVHRTRPFVYGDAVTLEQKMTLNARQSFYSGHTSQTAAMCFLTARLYADYHPQSKWKPVFWATAATIPAVTGVLRMTSGKHFITDVLAGYITGAAIGYFIPRLHQRMQQ